MTELNYRELVQLHQKYPELEILAFPCNQFGGQEPATCQQVKALVQDRYGVNFRIMDKVEVDKHLLWLFLQDSLTGLLGKGIKWNFTKFVINQQGEPVRRFGPNESPSQMEPLIKELLGRSG